MGDGVVNYVHSLDALIVRLDPHVDPERLDANDLFLLVGHGAGDVHHVDDARDALRQRNFLPAAILLVGALRHDNRLYRIINAGGNIPFERALVGSLEMTQRFRANLANAAVSVTLGEDVLLAPRLNSRQDQLLAEDFRQFFQREFDFKNVTAGLIAGFRLAVPLRVGQRLAHVALALSHAAGAFLTVAELRYLNLRKGDADQFPAFLADHFPATDVLAEIAFDLAANDLTKALVVAFDLLPHGTAPASSYGPGVSGETGHPVACCRVSAPPDKLGAIWAVRTKPTEAIRGLRRLSKWAG